jgi:hypothetical protein
VDTILFIELAANPHDFSSSIKSSASDSVKSSTVLLFEDKKKRNRFKSLEYAASEFADNPRSMRE